MQRCFFAYHSSPLKNCILVFCLCIFHLWAEAQPFANFSTDKIGGCSPLVISFTNTTSGASVNATYTWDFGNGNTSNAFNGGAIYTGIQTYTVTLTVKDGSQTSVKTQQVTVYPAPVVDFSIAADKVCIPDAAGFTASAFVSSGSISSYYWDFGDGTTLQAYTPSQQHYYTVPQKPTVSLTAISSYGCSNTVVKTNIVQIFPALNVAFSADQNVLCKITDSVHIFNKSTGPGMLTYLWDFGDGTTSTQTNPIHCFNAKGIYTVKLAATSQQGCTVSVVQTNYLNVASYKSDFNSPALICEGNYGNFNFTGSPQPATSVWKINNVPVYSYGTSLSYYFPVSGDYTIQLNNNFGNCPDSAVKTVSIQKTPYLKGFIADIANKCGAPATVNYKDTTAGVTQWNWDMDLNTGYQNHVISTLQNPSNVYPVNGTYYTSLKVTTAAGCSYTTQKYITISAPAVSIGYTGSTSVCGPFQLVFNANIQNDSIINYNWNFGDGTYSSSPQPTHLFNKPGTYIVSLIYTTKNGCSGVANSLQISENERPNINFSASQTDVCGNMPVSFPVAFNGGAYNYTPTYFWNFGDNTVGYGNGISHVYSDTGTYSIKLTASFGFCGDTTIIKNGYITVKFPFPKISSVSNTCDGTRGDVLFTQSSSGATSIVWNFGDGSPTITTPGNQATIKHTYIATGSYKVILTAINNTCSLTDAVTAYVLLKQTPILSANLVSVCGNGTLNITASNFETNPKVTYSYSSDYSAVFAYGDGTPFTGSSYINTAYGYWRNNFTGTLSNFLPGKKDIRLISTSVSFGCNDTSNYIPLSIQGSSAIFKVLNNNTCFKNPVQFKDSSVSTSNNSIQKWEWNFGDGIIQTYTTGNIVSHLYGYPGYYYAQLRIYDAAGCVSSSSYYSNSVQVNGPKAAFSVSNINPTITEQVYFYNYTNNYNSYNTTYYWTFGDNTSSTNYSPSAHVYTMPGTYTVQLITTNQQTGCADTSVQTITVKNFVSAFTHKVSFILSSGCPPVLANFTNNSYNYSHVSWDFGDGTTADNVNYPSHIYKQYGKYIITLYVYGPAGITGTYTDSIIIKTPSANIALTPDESCIGQTVSFTGSGDNVTTYLWDFGDGTLLNDKFTTQHQYNAAGIYHPALLIKDANGCLLPVYPANNIKVRPNPVISVNPAQPLVCKGSAIQLNATGGSQYLWSPGKGLNNNTITSPLASPDTSTTYTIQAQDDIGCTNSNSVFVKVIPPFTMKASNNTAICYPESVQLFAAGANNYQWINNITGLSNTQIANPVASPTATTAYTVVGKDTYNCFTDTANITVKVNPLPTVKAGQTYDLSPGISMQLSPVVSSDVIRWNWVPANYLSCVNCASPTTTPRASTQYTITVANAEGCTASDKITVNVLCSEDRIFIPSAFTPNHDGTNDAFVIKGVSFVKHMAIFNRWGNKIYERDNFLGDDKTAWWDGTVKGIPAEMDTYVYMAELQCAAGNSFVRKGTVVLIR